MNGCITNGLNVNVLIDMNGIDNPSTSVDKLMKHLGNFFSNPKNNEGYIFTISRFQDYKWDNIIVNIKGDYYFEYTIGLGNPEDGYSQIDDCVTEDELLEIIRLAIKIGPHITYDDNEYCTYDDEWLDDALEISKDTPLPDEEQMWESLCD